MGRIGQAGYELVDTLFMALMLNDTEAAATPGVGPTGAPTGGDWEGYGSVIITEQLVRMTWTNTDTAAYTRVYNGAVSPANLLGSALPGATSYDSDLPANASYTINLTHYRNGQESAAHTFPAGYLA